MKKKIFALIAAVVAATLVGCDSAQNPTAPTEDRQLVGICTVDATCNAEGYVERTYSDGYVCRDTFTPKSQHKYIEFTYGAEKNLTRYICRDCGSEKLEYREETISGEVTVDRDRERPSFAGLDVMACAMIIERNAADAVRAIRIAESHGAFGFMVYVSCMDREERTLEKLEQIMHCTDKPILAIAYGESAFYPQSLSAAEHAALLKLSIEAGAAAVDMPGYLFGAYDGVRQSLKDNRAYWEDRGYDMSFVSASPKEVCGDPALLAEQKKFIDEIHALDGEVLISVHAGVAMTSEQIVALNMFIRDQNADIIKLVLSGSSKETVIEHLKACVELEKRQKSGELNCKFSVHGQSTLSRLMCPMFGSYIAFCVDRYTEVETNIQIELDTMVAILNSPELKGAK